MAVDSRRIIYSQLAKVYLVVTIVELFDEFNGHLLERILEF